MHFKFLDKYRKKYPKIMKLVDIYIQYSIFIIGGGISLILDMILTWVLTEVFFIHYIASYAIALLTVFSFLFIYHTYITFKKHKQGENRFVKFVLISLLIMSLNWTGVYIITELTQIHYLISIFLVAIFFSIFNYILNRKFVFKLK